MIERQRTSAYQPVSANNDPPISPEQRRSNQRPDGSVRKMEQIDDIFMKAAVHGHAVLVAEVDFADVLAKKKPPQPQTSPRAGISAPVWASDSQWIGFDGPSL